MNLSLEKFEWSIWRIGRLSLQLPGLEFDPTLYRDEQKRIQAAYFDVLGISGEDDQAKQQQAIDKVILRLQELLGHTDLTQLRAKLVKNATQTLQNPD